MSVNIKMYNLTIYSCSTESFRGSLFFIEKITVISYCNISDSIQGNILLKVRKYIQLVCGL